MLALLSVAVATMAALMAHIGDRIGDDQRSAWVAGMLGVYGLIAIPAAALGSTVVRDAAAFGAARFCAQVTVIVLTVLIAVGPRPRVERAGLWTVLLALLLTLAAARLGALFPAVAQALTNSQPLRAGLVVVWMGVGFGVVAVGVAAHRGSIGLIGVGATLLGIAHAIRIGTSPSAIAAFGMAFSVVRLVGVLVALAGALALLREMMHQLHTNRADYEDQLRQATRQLDLAAERDHELRNGLAGLAGATSLLSGTRTVDEDVHVLGTAVASELTRLDALLQHPIGVVAPPEPMPYEIEPVLRHQATLRASMGMRIQLACDDGLRSSGCPDVLAQVVANC